jgi:hypothetical protein
MWSEAVVAYFKALSRNSLGVTEESHEQISCVTVNLLVAMLREYELARIWKEAVVAYSRYYPNICFEGQSKPMKSLSRHDRCPRRDSNRVPPKQEPRTLPLCHPARLLL